MTDRMLKFILTAALVVAVCAPLLLAQDENLNIAKNLLSEKKYDETLRKAKLFIKEYPEWFWGYFLAGHAYQGKNDYLAAIDMYSKALDYAQNEDETFQVNIQIAKAYYDQGDFNNTLRFIIDARSHVLSKHGAYAGEALCAMEGFSNYNLNRYQATIDSFKPLMDAGKASPDMMRAIATSHMELGDNDQAIDLARQILVGDQNDLPAYKIWIQSHINLKQWNEAISIVEMAEKKFWNDVELCYLKAQALSEAGKTDAAISSLERTSFVFNIPKKVPRLLARLYFEKGDYLGALMQYMRARDEYQDDVAFLLEFASCCNLLVPADAERYQNKPEASLYESALNDAREQLEQARALPGVNEESINSLLKTIEEKRLRLTRIGCGPRIILYVDPNTGEIIKKRNDKDKK